MPSGNHDMDRISRRLSEQELKLAYAFLYALPGAPFLYYGDEIGMRYVEGLISVEGGYERTGSRTPMQWDKTTNGGFSSAPAEKLYISMDPDPARPDVASQMADPDSVYHTVKKLLAVRAAHETMGNLGAVDFLYVPDHGCPLVFERRGKGDRVLVILNPSRREQMIPADVWKETKALSPGDYDEVIFSCGECPRKENGTLTAAPMSAVWLLARNTGRERTAKVEG